MTVVKTHYSASIRDKVIKSIPTVPANMVGSPTPASGSSGSVVGVGVAGVAVILLVGVTVGVPVGVTVGVPEPVGVGVPVVVVVGVGVPANVGVGVPDEVGVGVDIVNVSSWHTRGVGVGPSAAGSLPGAVGATGSVFS
ncbi:MAG: hypothetical protein ACC618_00550 [Patescibacteria group bacterium]